MGKDPLKVEESRLSAREGDKQANYRHLWRRIDCAMYVDVVWPLPGHHTLGVIKSLDRVQSFAGQITCIRQRNTQ